MKFDNFLYTKQSAEVSPGSEREILPHSLVLGVSVPVFGLDFRTEPPDQRHRVPEAGLHLL